VTLSACVITLNEEKRIQACLESLSFADEIIVLDSHSKDRTREIARRMGARVHTHAFDGFVAQKNRVLKMVRGRWTLIIDADEIVTPELREEILGVIRDPEALNCVAYRMPRMSYYLHRWIKHCGWYPECKTRLFQSGKARYAGGVVHEILKPEGPVGYLKGRLEHYSYESISDHLKRIDYYSTLIAQDKFRRGRGSSPLWAIGKSFSKFFITYFLRLGFLDGRAGLVISVLAGYYNFLKYVKLWELNKGYAKLDD